MKRLQKIASTDYETLLSDYAYRCQISYGNVLCSIDGFREFVEDNDMNGDEALEVLDIYDERDLERRVKEQICM